jgi:hypothetical protein
MIPPHICSMCIKNQPSRQTGSRNLMGPKTLHTILCTNMKDINICIKWFKFIGLLSPFVSLTCLWWDVPDRSGASSTYHVHRLNLKPNPIHGEVYSIQHYVIKFVSDLWQVDGFLQPQVLRLPLPIKLTPMIKLKYCWEWHKTP